VCGFFHGGAWVTCLGRAWGLCPWSLLANRACEFLPLNSLIHRSVESGVLIE